MDINIRVVGLEQVQDKLRQAPRMLVARGFIRALDRAAGVIAAEVEMRAPIGKQYGEEILKESVITVVELDAQNRGGTASVGFNHQVRSERTGKPADAIALWVEYGHREVAHDGQKVIGEVQPYPFMRPAYLASAERAIDVFVAELDRTLDEVFERVA